MFSDGFADQFGGEHNKKFNLKNFKTFLISIQDYNIIEHGKLLEAAFNKWKGKHEQIDDVCVLCVEI